MKARLLLVLTILTLAAGCAQGYYDTPAGLSARGYPAMAHESIYESRNRAGI